MFFEPKWALFGCEYKMTELTLEGIAMMAENAVASQSWMCESRSFACVAGSCLWSFLIVTRMLRRELD